MDTDQRSERPFLTELRSAHPGPPATDYRAAAVKVIAAFVYEDGVVIEWLTSAMPELPNDPAYDMELEADERFLDRPGIRESFSRMRRLSNFWDSSELADDAGTAYESSWSDAGSQAGGGYRGRLRFMPAPPKEAKRLTLRVQDDLAITIDMRPV